MSTLVPIRNSLRSATRARSFVGILFIATMWLSTVAGPVNADQWPVEMDTPSGRIVVFQPDPETLQGNTLTGRAAVSVEWRGTKTAIYGAIWFEARLATDREGRSAIIQELKISRVRFPEATTEQQATLRDSLQQQLSGGNVDISLDRLVASLEFAEHEKVAAENLNNDPPKIIFTKSPTVLVFVDGEPVLEKIDDSGIMQVVNTPNVIVFDPTGKKYYLKGGEQWLSSAELSGPWRSDDRLPPPVARAVEIPATEAPAVDDPSDEPELALAPPRNSSNSAPPQVLVETEPAELIVTNGEPRYVPIAATDLLYVQNSENDVFLDLSSQQHFVLLSGRWFASKELNGPWQFVKSDTLPAGFARIPQASPKSHTLVHVAGTIQANEAVMDASVPQTATIDRDADSPEVVYDGQPKFESIAGTEMSYAVNTADPVVWADGNYYLVRDAVWYQSPRPRGPWRVSVAVPPVVYTIPPRYPIYPIRFVRIFGYTPRVVHVGYYPGYLGSYVHGRTIVFGTGYRYRPWHRGIYLARPATWGFSFRYNAFTGGWGFGFNVGWGPSWFGFRSGRAVPGWWGPGGYGFVRNNNIAYYKSVNVTRNVTINNRNVTINNYGRGGNNIYARAEGEARGAGARQPGNPADAANPRGASRSANDVYTDRDGNVYRRGDDGWRQRSGNDWSPAGSRDALAGEGERKSSATDAGKSATGNARKGSGGGSGSLDRAASARNRGESRAQDFNRSRVGGSGPPGRGPGRR